MLAAELHATQKRKKDDRDVPYISHLLAVAALVLEDGGSEDEAIAGLLHDALEDQGLTGDRVDAEFGSEVARIVRACSDAQAEPGANKAAWLPRKLAHLAHLEHADDSILRVTAADKLHNCLDVVAGVERDGSNTLMRFNGKIDGTCWYYGAMAQLVSRRLPNSGLSMKLELSTRKLHELVAIPYPAPRPVYLGSDEQGPLPDIDEIWRRIVAHAGEVFRQVRGGEFTYQIVGSLVCLDRTNQKLSKAVFEQAVQRLPFSDTTVVQDLQGPSYLYAILMDPRITGGDW